VGSSGVGKSTLLNTLSGTPLQETGAIRGSDDRGRHTTSRRQLVQLPTGGVLIDTPGLRELQLWASAEGLAETFGDVAALARECRFRDCAHRDEPGCAVQAAMARGELEGQRVEHHRKLEAELRFLATRDDPWSQRARKRRDKRLCKAQKRRGRGSLPSD
jgi:ribosome biogenesis GTPase